MEVMLFVLVKLSVIVDETGFVMDMPGLMTPTGPFEPLIDYFIANPNRGMSSKELLRRSLVLFIEYMMANPNERDKHSLFVNFANRLETGTFGKGVKEGEAALGWRARSPKYAQDIITSLTQFFKWRAKTIPAAAEFNPPGTDPYVNAIARAAYIHRREAAMLGHTWDALGGEANTVNASKSAMVIESQSPRFPDDRFLELLRNGFRIGKRYDYRGILITLLLHGAGFRESEVMHLYIEDVVADPANQKSALVRIHHPSIGEAPSGWRDASGRPRRGPRSAYLAERFGLRPRNQLFETKRSGWKGGLYDGKFYKEARWFPAVFGEMFWTVWTKYLRQVALVTRTHPYAFVNLNSSHSGEFYKLSKYNAAHARACRRIGLVPRKERGTTPHGHRHAYAQRLIKGGVKPFFIQRFLHQASEKSQERYTVPSATEIYAALQSGEENLREKHSQSIITNIFEEGTSSDS